MPRLLAALPLLLVLAACGGDDSAQPGWHVRFSQGVTLDPPVAGQEFSFAFPLLPGSVHYITRPAQPVAGGAVAARFAIVMDGVPAFDYRTAPDNICDRPASVHLLLQRSGDDLSGDGPYEFYRWWSKIGSELKPGTATLDVPLDPAQWISVFGRSGDTNPAAFKAALADLGNVGVTFGGGCFFGHGVRITGGSATFTMQSYTLR